MMEGGSLSQEDVSYRQQASLWPLPGLARDAETLDFLPWPGSRTLSEKPTLMGSVHLFSFLAETPILLISSSFTLGPLSVWEQDCHAWPASLFPVCICQASAHWGTVYSVLDLIGAQNDLSTWAHPELLSFQSRNCPSFLRHSPALFLSWDCLAGTDPRASPRDPRQGSTLGTCPG